jgi:2,5-furandicarboxylate decarboxylase 1
MPKSGKTRQKVKGNSRGKSLSDYLDLIRRNPDEFRTVSRTVNPMNFDVTAVLKHLDMRGEYPTVQFDKPLDMYGKPSKFPIVSNLWATRERCAEAVGLPRSKAGGELGALFANFVDKKINPVVVSSDNAPVHANVFQGKKADMWKLPSVRHFEMDLGGVLTMGLVAHAPGEDFYNVTFVKTFPESPRRGGLTIHSAHMSRMTRLWKNRGERFPVINVLGHHPAFWLGTLNSTPWGDDEYATAGAFLHEPVRLAPSVTWGNKFLVPADAEIIIEGEIGPNDRTIVDPFGEISGQYQPQQFAPMMNVTAITYRDGALFQDIFSGHREHMLMASVPREGSIFNHVQEKLGNVVAVHLPYSGCARFTAYISIKKTGEGQAKQAAIQAFAHVPNLHVVVVVDEDIDVFNEEQVLWAVNTYVDPDRDLDLIKNVRPPSDPRGIGSSRVIFDATRPTHVPFPTRLRVPPEALARVKLSEWLDSVKKGKK